VVNEVNPDWLYDYEQRHNLNMQGADHWRNLLCIDSSRAVNLMIGDAGYLQLLVHDDDLQRQDFSRLYIDFESS